MKQNFLKGREFEVCCTYTKSFTQEDLSNETFSDMSPIGYERNYGEVVGYVRFPRESGRYFGSLK